MKPAPGTVFLEDKFNKVQVRPAPKGGATTHPPTGATIWFKPTWSSRQTRYVSLDEHNFDSRVVNLVAQKLIDLNDAVEDE